MIDPKLATDNAAQVCRRCKGTGVRWTLGGRRRCTCTPAPAKTRGPRTATHEGECGVCERRFSIGRVDERLALHGFRRPGGGWLLGECPGQNRLPVERSTETLVLLETLARKHAEAEEETLAFLRSEEVKELHFEIRHRDSYNLPRTATHAGRFESVIVRKGDGADYTRGIPAFDDLLSGKIKKAETDARNARDMEKRAQTRIAAWAPSALRLL